MFDSKIVTDMKLQIIIIHLHIIISESLNDNHKPFTRVVEASEGGHMAWLCRSWTRARLWPRPTRPGLGPPGLGRSQAEGVGLVHAGRAAAGSPRESQGPCSLVKAAPGRDIWTLGSFLSSSASVSLLLTRLVPACYVGTAPGQPPSLPQPGPAPASQQAPSQP